MNNLIETKLLVLLMAVGFCLNFFCGVTGSFFPPENYIQMTIWQIGDALAIMACVLAGRYIGNRGQNIAAAGFTMLAIAYGVSFASSNINSINEEKMATIILPLLPALFLISFCKLFSLLLICIPFLFVYKNVTQGTYNFENISNTLAYTGIQLLGLLWTFSIYKDFKINIKQRNN
jgi:hypothetical protein